MARIVALVGSPNESGNTATMVNSVLDGAMGLSTNTIEYYNLWKCSTYDRGEFVLHCHDEIRPKIDDSAEAILNSIRDANLIVFGTPVYFDMPTSQFQLILEYMYSMLSADFSESELKGKKAIIAVSCSKVDESSLNVIETIERSLNRFQIQVVEKMIYQDCKGPIANDSAAKKKAALVGAKFIRTFDVEPSEEVLVLN